MPFKEPITAGNVLILDAIESEGYVAGVSGWSIQKTGNAEFNSITIRGGWVVQGTPPNQLAKVEGGLYNGSQPAVRFTDEDGFLWALLATGSPGEGVIGLVHATGITSGFYVSKVGGLAMRSSIANKSVLFDDATAFLRTGTFVPAPAVMTIDTYQNIAPLNGWTNSGGTLVPLRCLKLPTGMVHLEGTIAPGTTVNGTFIGQLPAGYRPITNRRRLAWSEVGFSGFIEVQTDGNLAIFGAAGPATVSFCGQFPLL